MKRPMFFDDEYIIEEDKETFTSQNMLSTTASSKKVICKIENDCSCNFVQEMTCEKNQNIEHCMDAITTDWDIRNIFFFRRA
jgi:hypothetical protein